MARLSSESQSHGKDPRIRVLVVDDHKMVREGVARLLAENANVEVVGEAADGQAAVDLAERMQPDVIVMDINMPGMNGIEATRQIRSRLPRTHVVAMSMHEEREIMTMMEQAGATAYVPKGRPLEELLRAIQATAARLREQNEG